jgi:hypothetical protein
VLAGWDGEATGAFAFEGFAEDFCGDRRLGVTGAGGEERSFGTRLFVGNADSDGDDSSNVEFVSGDTEDSVKPN